MRQEDILLKKEELIMDKIGKTGEYFFLVPVYPALMRKDVKIETRAADFYKEAAEETRKDLNLNYTPELSCEVVLWEENNLAKELRLNQHVLLFAETNSRTILSQPYVNFGGKKLEAYSAAEDGAEYLLDDMVGPPFVYISKNTNRLQATLLRNWSVGYLNEALKELLRQDKI